MDENVISTIKQLDLDQVPAGTLTRYWVHLTSDGIGQPISVPVMVAKGRRPGPTLGITAAVHGNELNGLPVIQRLFMEIDPEEMSGTIVGVLVVNVPGLLLGQRNFNDGIDPNHIMPGKKGGNSSQVYFYRFIERIVNQFDYLIDLHTASFGRVNSYYIRADMEDRITAEMAMLQNANVIVHNPPYDGTLRGAAADLGIFAITLEVGDPNLFQKGMIRSGLTGIHNCLSHLGITEDEIEMPETPTIICNRSYWTYTDRGGILRVAPNVTDNLKKGQKVATISNVFGEVIQEYHAPEDGVVIGKSINPVNQTGGRILHLGVVAP